MDSRARIVSLCLCGFFLSACGKKDRAEAILPTTTDSICEGEAITSSYIVRYHSGKWDYVENHSRENFKENYVRPHVDEIDFIEYDQKVSFEFSPRTVSVNAIDNWAIPVIEAPVAWQADFRGDDVLVAVIDSGVDITHPQLMRQIAYNQGESGAKSHNGIDDDENGFIDDYAGYNFFDNSADVTDEIGHGTHIAGIIAAEHEDTTHQSGHTQGIAPNAKILPVKFLGTGGSGTLSGALKGIDYAITRGARIINASWGGSGCSQSLRQKVAEAIEHDVLFVTAAGNSGNNLDRFPEYPAAFNLPLQITVGAIRSSLNMDSYSNYSRSSVHLFAPGTMIVSTMPESIVPLGYAGLSGTSMATPFVAAASAVLLSAKPSMTLAEVRNLLFTAVTADNHYPNFTSGRLNLGKAINAINAVSR